MASLIWQVYTTPTVGNFSEWRVCTSFDEHFERILRVLRILALRTRTVFDAYCTLARFVPGLVAGYHHTLNPAPLRVMLYLDKHSHNQHTKPHTRLSRVHLLTRQHTSRGWLFPLPLVGAATHHPRHATHDTRHTPHATHYTPHPTPHTPLLAPPQDRMCMRICTFGFAEKCRDMTYL